MYVCVWKTAKQKCTFHFLHPMTLAILWSSTPAHSLPYLLLDCHWDDSVDKRCNSGGEGTVSPRLGRLANLSPRLLLTPGGYSRQYFHFSRPIKVSRTGWLNGWSSVTSVCWQEKHPRHLIWPVSSFQDADVAQRRVRKKREGPRDLSRGNALKVLQSTLVASKGALYICRTSDQVWMSEWSRLV